MRVLLTPVRPISAEELIRSGVLGVGVLDMPTRLARFINHMSRRDVFRPNRRIGSVGSIDTINPATSSGVAMAWDVAQTSGVPVALRSAGPTQGTTTVRQAVNYTYGSSGVGAINQVAQVTTTVGAGAISNIAMDVIQNVLGQATATFSAIKELWIELLTTTQGGGANASQITMGAHATNPWSGILSATGTYKVASGGMWHHQDQSSAGLTVTAGDFLKTVNNDGANAASVRMTVFGFK